MKISDNAFMFQLPKRNAPKIIEVSDSDEDTEPEPLLGNFKLLPKVFPALQELSIKYSKKFKSLIIPNIVNAFPNLRKLQL